MTANRPIDQDLREKVALIIDRLRNVWNGNDDEYYPDEAVEDITLLLRQETDKARADEISKTNEVITLRLDKMPPDSVTIKLDASSWSIYYATRLKELTNTQEGKDNHE